MEEERVDLVVAMRSKSKDIFNKHAQKHMAQWNYNRFQENYRKLHLAIIAAIEEALNTEKK